MKIHEFKKIAQINHNRVTFIRIEPISLQKTLTNIIKSLSDLSWLNAFDQEFFKESFKARAEPTIIDIVNKLQSPTSDELTADSGEYVVSELTRQAIINNLKYLDLPIAELYSKQMSGNPGFDFHTQNDCETLIFGEAKYSGSKNAYGIGLKQVVEFIEDKKDLKDLADLCEFVNKKTLDKAAKGTKGFAIGFSAKSTSSKLLINNITNNINFQKLLAYEEIVLVAVNV
jgi:hypothetical protein